METNLSKFTEISKIEFEKMIGDLKLIRDVDMRYGSKKDLEKLKKPDPSSPVFFHARLSQLIREGKFPFFKLFSRCAKYTHINKFEQGKTYKLKIGDPIKLNATLMGFVQLLEPYKNNFPYFIFKTERENLVLCRIRNGFVINTQILKTY
ncbi:hypothetical protein HOD29_02655 [archaeon]|jgi:hypothetical protein|nr:hypothetical protein [archaeon]